MHRFRIEVSGQVQSVGFRPFVYKLAQDMTLPGRVFNAGLGAIVELDADAGAVDLFISRLRSELPDVARIDSLTVQGPGFIDAPLPFPFCIETTQQGAVHAQVMPDLALCRDCLQELFTPENPRYRYPLINCTYCGPRYSIIRQLPYDRPQTTMSEYPLCTRCEADYKNPLDRRFHAQPIACATCGPHVVLKARDGSVIADEDPFVASARLLKSGAILAMKGIGGYHLVCDATNADAVTLLRRRKNRPAKPLAVMALNLQSLEAVVQLTPVARETLTSREAPLTLLQSKPNAVLAETVAPNLNRFGVMLPYTPMQYLLMHALVGEPEGLQWLSQPAEVYLVMTSANASGMPIVFDDAQALTELGSIADYFLMHDRKIHMRNDDAIVDASGDDLLVVRRGRGMAPDTINLARAGEAILATGAELKSNLCLSRGDKAFLSQYIGDLINVPNRRYLQQTAEHLTTILNIEPTAVACELHPDYFSRQFAETWSHQNHVPLVPVQHHHAHAASVMAEHQLTGPTLAVVLDGFGLSEQGELWGGELLYLEDITAFERLGMFNPLPLPGADKASEQGWRIAAGFLHQQGRWADAERRFNDCDLSVLKQMLDKQLNTPWTSSAGRLFDCAAALLNISQENRFESESAMRLQSKAEEFLQQFPDALSTEDLRTCYCIHEDGRLDFTALLLALLDRSAAEGAALFHRCLIDAISDWVGIYGQQKNCAQIVLSGGVWLNRLLLDGVRAQLKARGLDVYTNRQAPVNDGNISLGQLGVAQAILATSKAGG